MKVHCRTKSFPLPSLHKHKIAGLRKRTRINEYAASLFLVLIADNKYNTMAAMALYSNRFAAA